MNKKQYNSITSIFESKESYDEIDERLINEKQIFVKYDEMKTFFFDNGDIYMHEELVEVIRNIAKLDQEGKIKFIEKGFNKIVKGYLEKGYVHSSSGPEHMRNSDKAKFGMELFDRCDNVFEQFFAYLIMNTTATMDSILEGKRKAIEQFLPDKPEFNQDDDDTIMP